MALFIEAAYQLLSDATTVVLGACAFWGLLFHRKKISAFVKVISSSILNERFQRMHKNLSALDNLNFNRKSDRGEIFAILGGIAGQLKGFGAYDPRFKTIHAEIISYMNDNGTFSEPLKRKVMFELHGLLDAKGIEAVMKILEDQKNG